MNKKEYRYFNLAKSVSYTSNFPKVHIGAVIINGHDILAVACNTKRSHPIMKKLNPLRFTNNATQKDIDHCKNRIHAEIASILKCNKKDLVGASIYVYRETKDGYIAMCRPCAACMHEIVECGITDIYYTTEDGLCHEEVTK